MWSKPGSPRSKVIDALAGVLCFLVWVVMDFPFLGGHGPDPKPGSQGWGGGGVAGRDLYESPKTLTPTATATATTSKAAATATADAYTSSSGSNSNKSLHVIICHQDDHNNRLGVRSQTTWPLLSICGSGSPSENHAVLFVHCLLPAGWTMCSASPGRKAFTGSELDGSAALTALQRRFGTGTH